MPLNSEETENAIKKLMKDVGMPDSQSLYEAFRNFRAMVAPDPWKPEMLVPSPLGDIYRKLEEAQHLLVRHTRDPVDGTIYPNVQSLAPSLANVRHAQANVKEARQALKKYKKEMIARWKAKGNLGEPK